MSLVSKRNHKRCALMRQGSRQRRGDWIESPLGADRHYPDLPSHYDRFQSIQCAWFTTIGLSKPLPPLPLCDSEHHSHPSTYPASAWAPAASSARRCGSSPPRPALLKAAGAARFGAGVITGCPPPLPCLRSVWRKRLSPRPDLHSGGQKRLVSGARPASTPIQIEDARTDGAGYQGKYEAEKGSKCRWMIACTPALRSPDKSTAKRQQCSPGPCMQTKCQRHDLIP